jgi:hypothetical protein
LSGTAEANKDVKKVRLEYAADAATSSNRAPQQRPRIGRG